MKDALGIILAGGYGTRLFPLTVATNKQLLPVFDKPMIYYPLTTLISFGIKNIVIISHENQIELYQKLFGNGEKWGLNITHLIQEKPKGIPQAFTIAKYHLTDRNILILGDNIIHGHVFTKESLFGECGSNIFAYEVSDARRYGVVTFDGDGSLISLEEKPKNPKSNFAVPGIYSFDYNVDYFTDILQPSKRGELEIVDLIREYNRCAPKNVKVTLMDRGTAWLDAGTPTSLAQASQYIQTIQERTGTMVGCFEEECLAQSLIDIDMFAKNIETYPDGDYKNYLQKLT